MPIPVALPASAAQRLFGHEFRRQARWALGSPAFRLIILRRLQCLICKNAGNKISRDFFIYTAETGRNMLDKYEKCVTIITKADNTGHTAGIRKVKSMEYFSNNTQFAM